METVAKYETQEGVADQKKQEIRVSDIQDQITSLIPLAGTIELTQDQELVLYAPVDEKMVEIRPDGLIYLPWMEYVTRLRRVFGMSWSLIPYGPPKKLGNFIHWAFWLIVKGKPYGFAVGEQQYFENDRMTYGDALEGAKSNALMRLCKGLGISLELWQPDFRRKWLEKYAESFPAKDAHGKPKLDKYGKQKTEWRKKGTKGNGNESISEPESTTEKPQPKKEESKKSLTFLDAMARERKRIGDEKFLTLLGNNGFESVEQITERKDQESFYRIVVNYPGKKDDRQPGEEG